MAKKAASRKTGLPVSVVVRGKDGKVKSKKPGTPTSGVAAKKPSSKKKKKPIGTRIMNAVTGTTAKERAKMNKEAVDLAKEVGRKVKS